jgi:hypothetical protein
MRESGQDDTPLWIPMAWVAYRKIYGLLGWRWYAYRLDANDDEQSFFGDFETLKEAQKATESGLGLA